MIVGIGCDIIQISRLRMNPDALGKRILTTTEYQIYEAYQGNRRLEYLAGRFAAKEAIIKALDKKKVLSEIEILNDDMGKLVCDIKGYAIHVSIAHEIEYAIAYAVCEK
ncbi:MAG: holo-ACP synthase [Bacilli bacterium]|nr:holo-ACP synthase [Bacilli bacterium]